MAYTPAAMERSEPLVQATRSALFTAAAFLYAFTLFLCIQKQIDLPPTDPVGVGRVTVDRASKLGDYLSYGAFLVVCSAGTIALRKLGPKLFGRLRRRSHDDIATRFTDTLLFTLPFFAAPFFFLTTRKEGWALGLPLLISCSLIAARRKWRATSWLRALFARELAPLHGLIVLEAASWMLFRYLVMGARIAHIPTLFLEIVFVALFVALFELAALIIVRLAALLFQANPRKTLAQVALAWSPLLLLPIGGLTLQPRESLFLFALALIAIAVPIVRRRDVTPGAVRTFLVRLAIPLFLFVFSYAAIAAPSWLDLFHRGETLGPASDYLRGKAPYRDVFVLHGLLEDGLLDAWLMELFGRDPAVAVARITVIAALTLPLLFSIGFLLFESIPPALLTAAIGTVTFVDNQRLVFHLAAVAALLAWSKSTRRRRWWLVAAGAISGVAIFYSFDIGLFAVVSALIAVPLVLLLRQERSAVLSSVAMFTAGTLLGAAPFLAYLASRDALSDFITTSFVTVPRIIDAVWSLPYPNLAARFRSDLSLRSLADYLLGEQMRFILNPLTIAVALIVIVSKWMRKNADRYTAALIILTIAAAIAQRSALGRADFRHQYFAAYLFAPIAMLLAALAVQRVRAAAPSARDLPFRSLLAGVSLLFAFVILWIPDLLNAKLDGVVSYRPRLSQIGYEDRQGQAVRDRIERLRYFAHTAAKPTDTIFDFSNQPAFYFFLDRANATRFYQVPIISPPPFQAEAIAALERAKPALVLRGSPERFDQFDGIPNEIRTPSLARYLDSAYRYWRTASGVELWVRREGSTARVVVPAKLKVPRAITHWADETLILPGIGSVTGAAGAEWRSDVVVHNPHDEPLRLHLRYAADRGNVDRTIEIRGYRTEVFKDVAATFFSLADSRGAMFIRYPSGRKPVVTVQSYDRVRPSSRVTESPLSSLAVAHAGTPHHALSFVGIEQGGTRRVNLGVINVGSTPLRIKIVCRTESGAVVGVPVGAVIDEGESYSLVDAPAALGAPLTGGITVHVDLLDGSAVAYASVIDPATGAHDTLQAAPSSFKR